MNILADASLPGLSTAFPLPFKLTQYTHDKEVINLLDGQDILLCRATLKVDRALLKSHQPRYIATATSGTDHLDSVYLNSQNITIIDAKGSNASAVADYVLASLAYLNQHHPLTGNKAGIIGMGHVGSNVYNRLKAADFEIVTFDPIRENGDPTFKSCSLDKLYQCDLLCIHAELHNTLPFPSADLINHQFLKQLKNRCVIINASRGGIINEQALLNNSKNLVYCTDVYLNEPTISKQIIDLATLCTPHIAGHSIEAKNAAVTMVSKKIHQLEGLSLPQFEIPPVRVNLEWQKNRSWQEQILTLYNPVKESMKLKQAEDKKSAFLSLRKSHHKRHSFSSYFSSALPQKAILLLT